jgi:hypothetical protein
MTVKGALTVQQRMQTVKRNKKNKPKKSVLEMQKWFHAHFGMWWAPAPKTIHRLQQQFQQDSTMLENECGTLKPPEQPCKEAWDSQPGRPWQN